MGPSRDLVPCINIQRPDVLDSIGAGLILDWRVGNGLMDWKNLAMDRHWHGLLGNAMQIDEIILRRD